jgi:pseudouridine-5'-phosphate glycosidase
MARALNEFLVLSAQVAEALSSGRAVVALETSVLAQGLPAPRNLEVASAMSEAVRAVGAEPAWTFLDGGLIHLGASDADLSRLCSLEAVAKVTRRDVPFVLASGGLGATTVSAMIWSAHAAGIDVAATGGIGGVHPGSGDVSADLLEIARTPVTLVCSGPKSIVDLPATIERLEELGVGILGYRCDLVPFFVVRESSVPLEHRAGDAPGVAEVARAHRALGLPSALLVFNPVPEAFGMEGDVVGAAVADCLQEALRGGVVGKDVTPFLLACLAERTGGASLEANVALLVSNAQLAAEVAAELAAR